jgi:hypothetical protein
MMHFVRLASISFGVLLAMPAITRAQEKWPTRSEVDAMFENVARQANSQMSGTKIDEYTTLRAVSYDKAVPVFSYLYASTVSAKTGRLNLNGAERQAMSTYHQTKTCGTHFRPFMKAYGLRVTHIFEDQRTGSHLITLTYSGKDCS